MVLGTSKRASTQRAEEMAFEEDDIPLAVRTMAESSRPVALSREDLDATLVSPFPTQDPSRVRMLNPTNMPRLPGAVGVAVASTIFRQDSFPATRPRRWVAMLNAHMDTFIYVNSFLFAGIPAILCNWVCYASAFGFECPGLLLGNHPTIELEALHAPGARCFSHHSFWHLDPLTMPQRNIRNCPSCLFNYD